MDLKQNRGLTLILICSVVAIGGFLFGYDTGVINGTQFYFSKFFDLSPALKGWVVGSALLGCFIGAIVAGPLSSRWGRRFSLIFAGLLFTMSAWGSGLPEMLDQSVTMLVIFRIIGGIGTGIASMNAPMYIAELSPAKIRGKMVAIYQLAIVLGFFLVFVATYGIGQGMTEAENISRGWRHMFWSELIPAGIFFAALFFVPESPRWLMLKGRKDEALAILTRINGATEAQSVANSIEESIGQTRELGISQIFKRSILAVIIIGSVLSILQQFTGINAVLYYGADIFEKALGFGQDEILGQQIILAGVNVVFTLLAMRNVDRWGRKPLIIYGSIGMISGFVLLGGTLLLDQVGILSLIGILMFIGSFSFSMGPIVWVYLSEMFPNKIRSVATSIAVAAQWAANYVVSQSFPMVAEHPTNVDGFWNGSLPYFIFIACILMIIWFVRRWMPETKGLTLEDIENEWNIDWEE